jgi:heme-degrading monooxygenase HmoA
MIVAHTVRRLKPGTFEQFAETFGPPEGAESPGWLRFYMLRAIADENEVITFGFFDGPSSSSRPARTSWDTARLVTRSSRSSMR